MVFPRKASFPLARRPVRTADRPDASASPVQARPATSASPVLARPDAVPEPVAAPAPSGRRRLVRPVVAVPAAARPAAVPEAAAAGPRRPRKAKSVLAPKVVRSADRIATPASPAAEDPAPPTVLAPGPVPPAARTRGWLLTASDGSEFVVVAGGFEEAASAAVRRLARWRPGVQVVALEVLADHLGE